MLMRSKVSLIVGVIILLTACSSSNGRYRMHQDQAPTRAPTAAELSPLEPRYEPLSRQGNMPSYTVLGNTYTVLPTARNYQATGKASWYGQKFHGHLTSNGEYYDMYGLSAAHRYLPLPTYVRVTNLNNGREVIVRVNDRGPFHPDRIIDLSYAAAYQLDMLHTGTAPVQVEAIYIAGPEMTDNDAVFVQLAALSSAQNAQDIQVEIAQRYTVDATTRERNGLYRVLLGPFDEHQASEWIQKLRADGFSQAFRVSD